jgi:hypothetical protein
MSTFCISNADDLLSPEFLVADADRSIHVLVGPKKPILSKQTLHFDKLI